MNSRSLSLNVGPGSGLAALVRRPLSGVEARPAPRSDDGEINEETLRAARGGDRRAQEAFVRWYERRVHAFLGRSLIGRQQVDDLAQEVFLRVLRALPRFEPGAARVSTWIFSIAVHLLADQRRRPRRWLTWFDEERAAAGGATPEERAMAREALTELEVALAELSPEQRMALALSEFHGLSQADVATAMGTSVATVKTRLFRARQHLRRRVPHVLSDQTGRPR